MRTIKFRAWWNKEKRFIDSKPFTLEQLVSGDYIADLNDCVVMQFTGLLDKNGKDVYEGDIVKILYTDWIDRDRDSMIGKVEYKHDSFQLNFGKGRYGDDEYGYLRTGPHGDFEVIGDIYSSPSLLEQKQ